MYAVILCGGSGTRLWPLSRKNYPKQFLRLYSERSLLQETYLRMRKLMSIDEVFFVTNQEGYPHVLEQIQEIEPKFETNHIIIEPKSLNTAPAMACAVQYLRSEMKFSLEAPILFLPSDHYIGNVEGFVATIRQAFETVGDNIGTIGIRATAPETGYGYIQKEEAARPFARVSAFCEKPERSLAEKYVASGEYVWNSGMYLMRINTFLEEIKKHAPEIGTRLEENWTSFVESFPTLPLISFDCAVSEKSDRVVVYEGDFGWSDIGSFDSLANISGGTQPGMRHIGVDSKNVYVHSANDRLVATIGLEDIAIVETSDSLLLFKRGRSEEVKKIVETLKTSGAKEIEYDLEHDDPCRH